MPIYTTEIASDKLDSDNPIHQRLIKAYHLAIPYMGGDVLEIGCGEGRGIELLYQRCQKYVAVDKIGSVLDELRSRFPSVEFHQMNLPPMSKFGDNSFDRVLSFQVIEHIKDDVAFLREINRVLRPGGMALLTTPNRKFTLSRNPWHIREYLGDELLKISQSIFSQAEILGVGGNGKVMAYYHQNRKSVQRITRFDIFDLQHRLPASWLRIPYELLNRMNRRKLQQQDDDLVASITHEDYLLTENAEQGLDLFCILTK